MNGAVSDVLSDPVANGQIQRMQLLFQSNLKETQIKHTEFSILRSNRRQFHHLMEPADEDTSKIRIGMFGGGGVGKTALTLRYLRDQFVEEYIPTLADDFSKEIELGGKKLTINIIDTAGQDDFREMRASFYQSVQGFILVYAITDRNSLFEAEEIHKDICQNLVKTAVPCVIVGNKSDLRDEDSVPVADGVGMAKKLQAIHLETSARTGLNVTEAFNTAIKTVQQMVYGEGGGGCCLLL
jgi:GTPase KRas protein